MEPDVLSMLIKLTEQQARIEVTVQAIHGEVRKTNGRVTKNEDDIQDIKQWRSYLLGGAAVIGVAVNAIWDWAKK